MIPIFPDNFAFKSEYQTREECLDYIRRLADELQPGESFAVERPVKKDSLTPKFTIYTKGTVKVSSRLP